MLNEQSQKNRNILIEIQQFYPGTTKNQHFLGTLHIYLDIDGLRFDLRGLRVFKNGTRYNVRMNEQFGEENGERIRYPLLSFIDQKINEFLWKYLKNEASEYVKKYCEEHGIKKNKKIVEKKKEPIRNPKNLIFQDVKPKKTKNSKNAVTKSAKQI